MVVVAWLGQAKKPLQQAMHRCGVIEVLAADDIGDALEGIIDDDGQMIARRCILARQYDIAPGGRIGRDWGPAQLPDASGVNGRCVGAIQATGATAFLPAQFAAF